MTTHAADPPSRSIFHGLRYGCRQLFAIGGAVVLTALLAGPVQAQIGEASGLPADEPTTQDHDITSTVWSPHFDEEVAYLLREEPAARTTALNDLIQVANQADRDLSAAVGPLFHVIGNDPKLSRRLKAVEALQSLGADDLFTSVVTTAVDHLSGLLPGDASEECAESQRQA